MSGIHVILVPAKTEFFFSKQKMKMPVPVLNALTWKNKNQAIPQK